jgi:hypothetical protein
VFGQSLSRQILLNRYVYIDKKIGKEREKEKKRKRKGTRIVKEKEKKGRLFFFLTSRLHGHPPP